jgi:dimethylamine monooxygenase subunit C
MLITGIKSRPVYDRLAPFPDALLHLVVGQGSGGSAMARLLADIPAGAEVEVMYSTESFTGQNHAEALATAAPGHVCRFASNADLAQALQVRLARAFMGTRLYLAGSESFIGLAMKVARQFDLNADEVLREHCGSLVRRVWCVHCDAYNENITQRVFSCAGCGKPLVVRDHYSRLMGAFMGVQGDAEVPGELPDASDLDT